jgi:hypothetical protein
MELLTRTLLLTTLVLGGCSTAVPVTARFPEPPGRLATTPCPALQRLGDTPNISDVSRTVTMNYTTYYECQVKTDAWIEWYQIQKHIFEQAGK